MSDHTEEWTNAELKAYILLYCAYADFNESNAERQMIIEKVGREEYLRIHEEFDQDNDYERIQKIQNGVKNHHYDKDQIDRLFSEIKELFMIDGEEDVLEHNVLLGLKHILQ